jgi:NAD(P)-dependent dehydrogenase (short-subunit alcohol dehydrogenase family)
VTGRVVVVTGAGSGIGRAVAVGFGAANDDVVLAGRSAERLQRTAEKVKAVGGRPLVVTCDVTDDTQVGRLMARAAHLSGTIDVVVCCAGVARVRPFTQLTLAEWDETVATTLTGTFLCCQHAVPSMRRGGLLMISSSIAGRTGFPEWSAYSAAKAGVLAFSQAIREELRPVGIRVTAVIAGAVDTPLWDQVPGQWNRALMLQPQEVARAIVRVADEPDHLSTDEVVLGHVAGKL